MAGEQPPTQVHRTGYQGFGSFFVERSVEDMITEPDATYQPPAVPFALEPKADMTADTPLGKGCRHLFLIDFEAFTFLNHGAFGGVCLPAHEEAGQWRDYCERQPLKFLDR